MVLVLVLLSVGEEKEVLEVLDDVRIEDDGIGDAESVFGGEDEVAETITLGIDVLAEMEFFVHGV